MGVLRFPPCGWCFGCGIFVIDCVGHGSLTCPQLLGLVGILLGRTRIGILYCASNGFLFCGNSVVGVRLHCMLPIGFRDMVSGCGCDGLGGLVLDCLCLLIGGELLNLCLPHALKFGASCLAPLCHLQIAAPPALEPPALVPPAWLLPSTSSLLLLQPGRLQPWRLTPWCLQSGSYMEPPACRSKT